MKQSNILFRSVSFAILLLLICAGCGESVEDRFRREINFYRSQVSDLNSDLGAKSVEAGMAKEKFKRASQELERIKVWNQDLEIQLANVTLEAKEKEEYINLAAGNERHRRDLMKRLEILEDELIDVASARDALRNSKERLQLFLKLVGTQDFFHWASNVTYFSEEEMMSFGSASLSLGILEGVLTISSKLVNPAFPATLKIGTSVQVDSYDLIVDYKESTCQLHFPNAKEIKSALKLSEDKICNIVIKLNDADVVLGFVLSEKKWFSKDQKFKFVSVKCGDMQIAINGNSPGHH
ncbi:MAG: hypothetical protein V5783_06950 [Pontiella sp.]